MTPLTLEHDLRNDERESESSLYAGGRRLYRGEKYFTTREGFDSYLIKITVSGCGILRYEGGEYLVPVGKFYWIDCRKWHDYRTSGEDWHVLWVHFYGAAAKYYYELFLANNGGKPSAVCLSVRPHTRSCTRCSTLTRTE